MMEQKLIDIYEVACKACDALIVSGEKINAQAIILDVEGLNKVYTFELTEKNKKVIADSLKERIIKTGAKGYILTFNTMTQKKNAKTKEEFVGQCILTTLYTPTERIREYRWYIDKTVLGKERLEGRELLDYKDPFDAWGNSELEINPVKNPKTSTVAQIFKNLSEQHRRDNNGGR